jgi:DNA-binding response OmpR family regulator
MDPSRLHDHASRHGGDGASRESGSPDGRSRHVTLVERDGRVRGLATHFLERAGYVVTPVADSNLAFDLVRTAPPALVITEILMPGLDGFALCRRLKADPLIGAVRVLILSMLSAQERAREAGADGFLRKPISETKLVAAVTAVLGLDEGLTRHVDG